jgi:hypothetical protein
VQSTCTPCLPDCHADTPPGQPPPPPADAQLCQSPNWLNDNVISWYYEWLRIEGPAAALPALRLVPPDIGHMLAQVPAEEAAAFLGSVIHPQHTLVRSERPATLQQQSASTCALDLCKCHGAESSRLVQLQVQREAGSSQLHTSTC